MRTCTYLEAVCLTFGLRYPIIKRRIAWLIGKWVSESCYTPKDPKIWEILVHLLQDHDVGTDTVVRLTATIALRECVDVSLIYRDCHKLD